MPRDVDHAARRRALAEALWRVVRREGIHRISVRTVAAEAGTSPGALRHYFTTQDDLAAFALQAVVDRVRARLTERLPALQGRDAAVYLLEQLLPLDDERRDETAVYLGFLGRPHGEDRLREIRGMAESSSREAVTVALRMLAEAGCLHPGRDVEAEVDRLYAMVDGLALHGTLWPERFPAEHLRGVLHSHLRSLAET
ncbi:TetR/AcrR family transcriptional regulator [Blastococcus deserti]|uniref:TetR/AcrR family transcriptional regulator n=1 Tax=Blastococcus deserti TaxID=2259033 RepID=A0ABW4XCV7_9ACTN